MKSITCTIVALALLSFSSFAQQLSGFKLTYQHLSADPQEVEALENKGIFQTVLLSKDYVRIMPTDTENPIVLKDIRRNEELMLFPQSEEYFIYKSEGPVVEVPESDLPINYQAGKTKTIAGYPCKFAQISFDNEEDPEQPIEMDIWYTETLPSIYWGEFSFLSEIKGAVLSLSVSGNGFQVVNIESTKIDKATFQIPENYTEINLDEDPDEEASEENYLGLGTEVAEDRLTYTNESGTYMGLKNSQGEEITGTNFTFIDYFHHDQAVAIDKNNKFGTIDLQGKTRIPFQYDYLGQDQASGQLMYGLGDKMGMMDPNGKVLIKAEYDQISFFSQGLATAFKGEKCGIINMQNKVIVPFDYDMIFEINPHNFTTYADEKVSLYNLKTNTLVSNAYDHYALSKDNALITVQQGDKYGFIDPTGKIVLPLKYSLAGVFENGIVLVAEDEAQENQYFINVKGEKVTIE